MRGKPDADAITGEQNAWASPHDMDAQDLTSGGPAPGERIVRTRVMSTPTTPIDAVAREVAAAAGTILGANASAVVRLDQATNVVEAIATTGPQDPAHTVSPALRDLVTRAVGEGGPVWEPDHSIDTAGAPPANAPPTLAIPLTGGDVLVLPGVRDAVGGTASVPSVVSAVGALASAALAQTRRATKLAREVDALQTGQHQTIETERLHAVGELAAGVAHHLNNVMTVILGSVELALRRPHSIGPDCLETVRQAALDATEIVRRLGSFSRRQIEGPRQVVDLNVLVEEAVALSRGRWQDEAQLHGIEIQVEISVDATSPVAVAEGSLREVLVSLLLNAIDALPEGGHIRVRTWSTEDVVHCEVADDGIGMSQEVRQRALEPFFTTKGLRRRGLGLSQSYGIIKQHGGTLTVESAERQGTRVSFTLPSSRSRRLAESESASARTGQMVILLVDDDPGVRAILASLLAEAGHTVIEASSGAEALSRLEATESFSLLMTDLGMPKMNGWELIRTAKLLRPELPVVLVTGWGETPRGQRPSDPQPDVILAKPVTEDDLRQAIVRFQRPAVSA
jgi:signal transduction histidine kinase/ActR/RegA family two-component response regulator